MLSSVNDSVLAREDVSAGQRQDRQVPLYDLDKQEVSAIAICCLRSMCSKHVWSIARHWSIMHSMVSWPV